MSKKILYEAVKAKLEDIKEKVSFGGIFNNNFNRESEERAKSWPVCFMSYPVIEWVAAAGTTLNTQKAQVEVCIHVGFKTIHEKPELFFDTIDLIYSTLEGLTSEAGLWTPLRRIREAEPMEYNNVYVWEIYFSTELTDGSASDKGYKLHYATDLKINKDLIIDNMVVRTGKFD